MLAQVKNTPTRRHKGEQRPVVDPIHDVISENVRTFMGKRDINQTELADAIGSNQPKLSRALHGHRPWQVDELHAIAAYFDVPLTLLFEDIVLKSKWFSLGMAAA
jgi:antitoxin component HigA of HigAB toxin-antitoxin module